MGVVDAEKCLNSRFWHSCAGAMVQIPPVNSTVYYFPQGHAEHSFGFVDFGTRPVPSDVLCRVVAVKLLADRETDEVYAKIRLVPCLDAAAGDGHGGIEEAEDQDWSSVKRNFSKTLTQSDANNGGGFSVPRFLAEAVFPALDFTADPPVQNVCARDVHGEKWEFRHIYRGTPRRHLLTTGWSKFVNHKKLISGDSIVFMRTDDGELNVGIRRAKRAGSDGMEFNSGVSGFSEMMRSGSGSGGSSSFKGCSKGKGKVRPEAVIEAATLAASGHQFEVVYYPRATPPEFCVKASSVRASMENGWAPGMRFKMSFEPEDSAPITSSIGTVYAVQAVDPVRWPRSLWRSLQVTWDEPELAQNVRYVSPWLVERVSNMPTIPMSAFSPPRKKLRTPQYQDLPHDDHLSMVSFPNNTLGSSSSLCCLPDNTPAGIQGARHANFGTLLPDFQLNRMQSDWFPTSFPHFNNVPPPSTISRDLMMSNHNDEDSVLCSLTIGSSSQSSKKPNTDKKPQFVLFGQPILTEQQMSSSCTAETTAPIHNGKGSSNENENKKVKVPDSPKTVHHQRNSQGNAYRQVLPWDKDHRMIMSELEARNCKVFMDSEDIGRTLDLSVLGSYGELYNRLANMFAIKISEMFNPIIYQDETGAVKNIGDEPFSKFIKTAKRLTVVTDSKRINVDRTRIAGLSDAENGLAPSNKRGLLSMLA